MVFDLGGEVIAWHDPQESCGAISDSSDLWGCLWEHREDLGGVAHTHPGSGHPAPSGTDLTTFAAIEAGLGLSLDWPIVTSDEVATFVWRGPGSLEYRQLVFNCLPQHVVDELRRRSNYDNSGG